MHWQQWVTLGLAVVSLTIYVITIFAHMYLLSSGGSAKSVREIIKSFVTILIVCLWNVLLYSGGWYG